MNVAVIENDLKHIELLKKEFHNYNFKFNSTIQYIDFYFFNSSIEFGKADLSKFDVIIADNSLKAISGENLIKSISKKTKAELLLMTSNKEKFSEDIIKDENIAGVIEKEKISSFREHLKYINTKININREIEGLLKKLTEIKGESHANVQLLL